MNSNQCDWCPHRKRKFVHRYAHAQGGQCEDRERMATYKSRRNVIKMLTVLWGWGFLQSSKQFKLLHWLPALHSYHPGIRGWVFGNSSKLKHIDPTVLMKLSSYTWVNAFECILCLWLIFIILKWLVSTVLPLLLLLLWGEDSLWSSPWHSESVVPNGVFEIYLLVIDF